MIQLPLFATYRVFIINRLHYMFRLNSHLQVCREFAVKSLSTTSNCYIRLNTDIPANLTLVYRPRAGKYLNSCTAIIAVLFNTTNVTINIEGDLQCYLTFL
jgi:hypothetical protein